MLLISGGKTGGHIVPLINLALLKKQSFIYVGTYNQLEEKLASDNQITFIGFPFFKSKIRYLINAYLELRKKLKKIKIDKIIISGGITSFPLGLYSFIHRIPLYIIECNTSFGFVNKVFYHYAIDVFYAFNKIGKKGIATGLPQRKETYFNKEIYDIIIIGGSLGSRVLCDIARRLSTKYKICLIAGSYYDEFKDINAKVIKYSSELLALMASSKLIICRGGGMTLSEGINLNKPIICIPSNNTKNNHQILNAKFLASQKVLHYFNEANSFYELEDYINSLFINPEIGINMKDKQRSFIGELNNKEITRVLLNESI